MTDKAKILVVDDDPEMQRLLNKSLKAAGYEVVFAGDGAGTISAVRRQAPDLVLLDIGLPAGDGFVVLERLRRNVELSAIPVLVYTADTGSEAKRRAIENGAAGFLCKSTSTGELIGTVQALLA